MASFSPSEKCYATGIYLEQERAMDKQFTASEVRRAAECPYVLSRNNDMLRAYADRLEADEKAVPVAYAAGLEANMRGFLDVMAWSEGEFTIPLYTHAASPDAERLAEALQEILNYRGGAANALEDEYVVDRAHQALAAHSAQAQPPAARVPDWTDAQCVAFMAVGLRHTEYKKGKSPTVEEIRQGAKAALAAQENPNG